MSGYNWTKIKQSITQSIYPSTPNGVSELTSFHTSRKQSQKQGVYFMLESADVFTESSHPKVLKF